MPTDKDTEKTSTATTAPKATPAPAPQEEAPAEFVPEDVPGFHVMQDDQHLGTYETEEDAQAFIDGHLDGEGEIVEGSEPEGDDEWRRL